MLNNFMKKDSTSAPNDQQDKISSAVRLAPTSNAMLKMKDKVPDKPQKQEKTLLASIREDKKKLTFNILGGYPSGSKAQEQIKRFDKKTESGGVMLNVNQKKGPKLDNLENLKEKNFWSRQFSKYSKELDEVMGVKMSVDVDESKYSEYRQCFDSISHPEKLSTLEEAYIAVAQNRYVIFMGCQKETFSVRSFVRLYSIELMRKKELEEFKVEVGQPTPMAGGEPLHSVNRPQVRFERDDVYTPMVDIGFIGFFKEQIESTGGKWSKKALISKFENCDFEICTYALSSNQLYLGLVFKDVSNTHMLVSILHLPSLEVFITTQPIGEGWDSVQCSAPFFSYQNDFGEEYDPNHLYFPVRNGIYIVDLQNTASDGHAYHVGEARPIRFDLTVMEDGNLIQNLVKVEHKDLLIGTIARSKANSELCLWTWDPKRGQGYCRVSGFRLTMPSRYKLLHNTLSKDGKQVFAFTPGGKDVLRINFKSSVVKVILRYNNDNKNLRSALVIDEGNYIIVSDSANEIRVFRVLGKGYQQIYCQFMADEVHKIVITENRKHLVVLSDKKITIIRLHLGQNCTYDVIGARPELNDLNGLIYSKNKKTIRFTDKFLEQVTLFTETPDGVQIKRRRTGISSENKNVIQIGDTDRRVVWDRNQIWIIQLPGQCGNNQPLSWRNFEAQELESGEEVIIMDFFKVKEMDSIITTVWLNLDNNYLFVYTGATGSILSKRIEVWSIAERRNIYNFNDASLTYCIVKEEGLILRWDPDDVSQIQSGYIENGECVFDTLTIQKGKSCKLVSVSCHKIGDRIAKLLFLTSKKLFIIDVNTMVIINRSINVHLENVDTLISPDGRYVAINEKNYRDILIYSLEPTSDDCLEAGFEITCNFIQVLKMLFSHDSDYLVCVDEEFKLKIISLRLKKEIATFSIQDSMPNPNVDICYMAFSEFSYSLICGFCSEGKSPKHYIFGKVPFYGTRYSPLDSIIGYYIQRYFYTSNLIEKGSLCRNIVAIVHSYPLYQVAINSVLTGMILLLNAPGLIEQYCANFIDFNVISSHGLLKHSMEKNKLFSLISYNSMFEAHALKFRENPYIDEEQIETLSKLESSKMNNRYSRAVLSQIVFSPIRSEYGELKDEDENIAILPLNYRHSQIEESITNLMKPDFSTINKYHCYVTQIPLDLSIGSEFSIAFFGNISNYSEEEIQSKYKVFIYYKWNQIYFLALMHSIIYWCLNFSVYVYMGKYADFLWVGIIICVLNAFFIMYEVKCFCSSKHRYLKDGWNQLDLFNHLLSVTTTILMMCIDRDQHSVWLSVLRFVSSLIIGIRGLSMLVVFRPIRYITTMFFKVLIDIWPFIVVLGYVMFISALAWSIEPQIEQSGGVDIDFITALTVIINTSMGNFNTTYGDGFEMTKPQLVLIIFVNIFSGLALLNFLISLISETYQRISEKRDYYDVLELLPIINEFDLLFKKRGKVSQNTGEPTPMVIVGGQTMSNDVTSHHSSGQNPGIDNKKPIRAHSKIILEPITDAPSEVFPNQNPAVQAEAMISIVPPSKLTTSPTKLKYNARKESDLMKQPSINPLANTTKKSQIKRFQDTKKYHYLCIIPEQEQSDQLRELKLSLQNSIRAETSEILDTNNQQNSKIDKLKYTLKETQVSQNEIKSMLQNLLSLHDQLNKRIDSMTQNKKASAPAINTSNISFHDEQEEDDKMTLTLNLNKDNISKRENADDEDSGGSEPESRQEKEFQNNIING